MVPENMIQIQRPEPPAVVQEMAPAVQAASSFAITGKETHQTALERIKALRSGERRITEYFEPSRKAADAAKREILKLRDSLVDSLAQARAIYDGKATAYETEQREKAIAEERLLQEIARKAEEDRILEQAAAAEAAGDKEMAEAILGEEVQTPTVQVYVPVAKVEGVSTRTTWSAEVFDVSALIKHAAAHPEWERALKPDTVVLNKIAQAQHEAMNIPGVRAVATTSRSTRD